MKIAFLQTCVPDYRLPVFDAVAEQIPGVEIFCGDQFFTGDIPTRSGEKPWHRSVENRFWPGRILLWQRGVPRRLADYDMVVCEYNPRILSTWALLVSRRLRGRKTLLWGHIWGRRRTTSWLGRVRLLMCRLSDGLICYSESQAAEMARRLPGLPVFAAPNSCVSRADCRVDAAESIKDVVYVGRLTKSKKVVVLVRGFARAAKDLPPNARLVVVGDGAERERLQALAEKLGIADRVDFPGHISDLSKLREIYASALVAVSPGYVGLSAIQCMAFGVPMLVSRDEPHSPEIEACRENETCRFFATDDANALATEMSTFYSSREWIARRPRIAEFTAAHYTVEAMAQRFASAIGHSLPETAAAVIVWAQYGPYHLARLGALQGSQVKRRYLGLEIASRTTTYAWERSTQLPIQTLYPDAVAESISALQAYRRALTFFLRNRVEVVFVPSYWPEASLGVLLAARHAGAAVVMMNDSHRQTAQVGGMKLRLKISLVKLFHAGLIAGKPQKEYFEELGMPPECLFDGYDAVDNAFFERASAECRMREEDLRRRYALPESYYLNIGRMEEKKNLMLLIRAYAQCPPKPGSPRLVFVGSGALEKQLQDECVKLGLSYADLRGRPHEGEARPVEADVYFYGFRQAAELPVFYSLATAFVLPSNREEWGLVVNEAMASGLPVLVSKVAGCARDLVHEGENGFLFDPESVEDLAGRLQWIDENREAIPRMGQRSREMVAAWDVSHFAENAEKAADAACAARDRQRSK